VNVTDEIRSEIVDTVRKFVEREVVPVASELEHRNEYPQALVDRLKELGLFGATSIGVSGLAGVLVPGNSDVLPAIQKDTVAFAGAAAAWRATEQFGISMELYAQSAYYDSELDEIGDHSIQLAVGGLYLTRANGLRLSFALIEDLFSDSTTDMAMQFSVSGVIRSRDARQ